MEPRVDHVRATENISQTGVLGNVLRVLSAGIVIRPLQFRNLVVRLC